MEIRTALKRRWGTLAVCVVAVWACGLCHAAAVLPTFETEDVARFVKVYEAAHGHPTAEQLERNYLRPGSRGLHEFAALRNVTGARIAQSIAAHPAIYVKARRCLEVLPVVRRRLAKAFQRLADVYPEAKFPPVTIVIGRGRPSGITDPSGVTIGLEAVCAADFMNPNLGDRFVHLIAHEYGHIQQPRALQALAPGEPAATVLRMSLGEGAAEFTGELISGGIAQDWLNGWTKGKEKKIGEAFLRDQDKTDLSAWLYNGPGDPAHPGDLGCWVGYRIVKSYYARAADKHAALRDIFEMRDPKAFLAKSGWRPGL
jgi:hypothetical protein